MDVGAGLLRLWCPAASLPTVRLPHLPTTALACPLPVSAPGGGRVRNPGRPSTPVNHRTYYNLVGGDAHIAPSTLDNNRMQRANVGIGPYIHLIT